jgi:hypothetical protein
LDNFAPENITAKVNKRVKIIPKLKNQSAKTAREITIF